jgi:hypothetical protein
MILVVALVAAAAAAVNLALLRSTQDSTDPVGRLSPRAVFSTGGPASGHRPAVEVPRGRNEPDD